jgi:hypothetical protein
VREGKRGGKEKRNLTHQGAPPGDRENPKIIHQKEEWNRPSNHPSEGENRRYPQNKGYKAKVLSEGRA